MTGPPETPDTPGAPQADHPWLRSYPSAIDWAAPIEPRSLNDVFDAACLAHADRPCIEFLGKRYSYGEVKDLTSRAARGLRQLGVGHGTRVALLLPNTPYYVICYFAILSVGGTVVNLNPLYAEAEVESLLRGTGTRIVVTLDLQLVFDKVVPALAAGAIDRVVLCRMADALPWYKRPLFEFMRRRDVVRPAARDAIVPFARLLDRGANLVPAAPALPPALAPELPPASAPELPPALAPELPPALAPVSIDPLRDVAVLQFTGGTTGTPKAAMLTHANVAANAHQIHAIVPELRDGAERFLGLLPLCHAFGMTAVMNLAIDSGSLMILLPRFDVEATLRTIARWRPTVFPGVPAIYAAINGCPRLRRYSLRSIRYCISGGAALPEEVRVRFEQNTGCQLVEGYGLSECSPVATCNLFDGPRKTGTIGLPLPGTRVEIRSAEAPGKPVALGERGEICIHGPQVMAGYLDRPDATDRALIDGWLHTGDIGYMDGDGFVFLVDRIKDVIVRDGYKVYPRIVEDTILGHPEVAEVIVIGVPDAQRGAFPKAFVRPESAAALDGAALRAYLVSRLSPVEIPREFEFRSHLPRTLVGKPDKQALLAEELARLSGDATAG